MSTRGALLVPTGLAGMSPRAPRRVLEELAARGQRASAAGQERPLVALELASGRTMSGRCVAVGDDGGLAMVLLHTGGSERAPTVVQLRLDQVVAVGYEQGGVERVPREAPSRLELARALAAGEAELARALGARLALGVAELFDDGERLAAAALAPVLRQALLRLAADEMGQAALRGLSGVQLGAAARRAVTRSGDELRVEAAVGPDQDWACAELVAAIEKVL